MATRAAERYVHQQARTRRMSRERQHVGTRRTPGWRSTAALLALTLYDPPAPTCSEATFQTKLNHVLVQSGLRWYHANQSKFDQPGLPDLIILGPEHVLWRELKTAKGRLKPEQREWLADLTTRGEDAKVWRPADWPEILETLGIDPSQPTRTTQQPGQPRRAEGSEASHVNAEPRRATPAQGTRKRRPKSAQNPQVRPTPRAVLRD